MREANFIAVFLHAKARKRELKTFEAKAFTKLLKHKGQPMTCEVLVKISLVIVTSTYWCKTSVQVRKSETRAGSSKYLQHIVKDTIVRSGDVALAGWARGAVRASLEFFGYFLFQDKK